MSSTLQSVLNNIAARQAVSALEVIGNLTNEEKFRIITESEGGVIALDSILLTILNAKRVNASKSKNSETDLVPPMVAKNNPQPTKRTWADETEEAEKSRNVTKPAVLSVATLTNETNGVEQPIQILKNQAHASGYSNGKVPQVVVPLQEVKQTPTKSETTNGQTYRSGWTRKPQIQPDNDSKGFVQRVNTFQRPNGTKQFNLLSVKSSSEERFQTVGPDGKPLHAMDVYQIDPTNGLELVEISVGRFGDKTDPIFSAAQMERFGCVQHTHKINELSMLTLVNMFPAEFALSRTITSPKDISDFLMKKKNGLRFYPFMYGDEMWFSIAPIVRIGQYSTREFPNGKVSTFMPQKRFPLLFRIVRNELLIRAVRRVDNPEYSHQVLLATCLLLAFPELVNACKTHYEEIASTIAKYLHANEEDTTRIKKLASVIAMNGVFVVGSRYQNKTSTTTEQVPDEQNDVDNRHADNAESPKPVEPAVVKTPPETPPKSPTGPKVSEKTA